MGASTSQPTRHPVYKAVHRPLTLCGLERRLFFGALMTGAAVFNLSKSLLGGTLVALGLYCVGLVGTKRDPQILRIIFMAARLRLRYDPAKHAPVHIEVRSC
jgi:type IV secretory pathway VirB3-like protein